MLARTSARTQLQSHSRLPCRWQPGPAVAAAASGGGTLRGVAGVFADGRVAMLSPLALVLVLLLAFGERSTQGRTLHEQRAAAAAAGAGATVTQLRAAGWLNDPHGLFKHGGLYHQFFQYNPTSIAWAAPFWGHVVSPDLAHWRWLPPALLPDSADDFSGVWSGAATISDDGTPWLSYTAASTFVPELGNYFQGQGLAAPANASDPYLRAWRKAAGGPVLLQTPPGGTNFQFRDTTPANRDVRDAVALALAGGGRRGARANASRGAAPRFAWAVGAQAFCLGTAAIYTAPALEGPWSFAGNLFNQLALDSKLNGQCEAPGKAPRAAFGGPCNQFGSKCRMWEVVDFVQVVPGVYAVKWSDQDRGRAQFSAEWYTLSDELDASALSAGPDAGAGGFNNIGAAGGSALRTLLTGRLNGQPFKPLRLGYGSTYASKFEHLGDRLVINTWVFDTFEGCVDSCSDHGPAGNEYVQRSPFKGVLQLPRAVNYSEETRSLVMFPLEELKALRQKQVLNTGARALPASGAPVTLLPEGRLQPGPGPQTARQLHARLEFTISLNGSLGRSNVNFTAGARILTGGASFIDVRLAGTAAQAPPGQAGPHPPAAAAVAITSLSITVDKSRAGSFTGPPLLEGGPIPLPVVPAAPWQLAGRPLALDLFLDHSIVEAYALGGLGRVASRVYPGDEASAWGLAAFGTAAPAGASAGGLGAGVVLSRVEAWALGNAWAAQPPLC